MHVQRQPAGSKSPLSVRSWRRRFGTRAVDTEDRSVQQTEASSGDVNGDKDETDGLLKSVTHAMSRLRMAKDTTTPNVPAADETQPRGLTSLVNRFVDRRKSYRLCEKSKLFRGLCDWAFDLKPRHQYRGNQCKPGCSPSITPSCYDVSDNHAGSTGDSFQGSFPQNLNWNLPQPTAPPTPLDTTEEVTSSSTNTILPGTFPQSRPRTFRRLSSADATSDFSLRSPAVIVLPQDLVLSDAHNVAAAMEMARLDLPDSVLASPYDFDFDTGSSLSVPDPSPPSMDTRHGFGQINDGDYVLPHRDSSSRYGNICYATRKDNREVVSLLLEAEAQVSNRPGKVEKTELGEFLANQSLGSWGDEIDDFNGTLEVPEREQDDVDPERDSLFYPTDLQTQIQQFGPVWEEDISTLSESASQHQRSTQSQVRTAQRRVGRTGKKKDSSYRCFVVGCEETKPYISYLLRHAEQRHSFFYCNDCCNGFTSSAAKTAYLPQCTHYCMSPSCGADSVVSGTDERSMQKHERTSLCRTVGRVEDVHRLKYLEQNYRMLYSVDSPSKFQEAASFPLGESGIPTDATELANHVFKPRRMPRHLLGPTQTVSVAKVCKERRGQEDSKRQKGREDGLLNIIRYLCGKTTMDSFIQNSLKVNAPQLLAELGAANKAASTSGKAESRRRVPKSHPALLDTEIRAIDRRVENLSQTTIAETDARADQTERGTSQSAELFGQMHFHSSSAMEETLLDDQYSAIIRESQENGILPWDTEPFSEVLPCREWSN